MSTNDLNSSGTGQVLFMSREKSTAILDTFLAMEYKIFTLNGSDVRSKEELLSDLSQKMKFPAYFGSNWDALEECLNDLEWLPAKGYVLQLRNADDFMKCCNSDFEMFVQIIESVSRTWEKRSAEFILIVETEKKGNPG